MSTTNETADARRPAAPVSPITLGLGLHLDAGADDRPCVWNVVAYEGEWQGHPAGAFGFSRATFEQIIANFCADPRYKRRGTAAPRAAAPEQIESGIFDVIQWDFHHAAEMPAPELAVAGAPAQGWVLELAIGDYEGKCALLALTRWLEPARGYIRGGRYKFCSVSVWLNATDPATGKDVGAVLTSIAITNNPFLQGLPALQASRSAAPVLAGKHWYSPAPSPDEAFGNLRSLLGMPETATVPDMAARFALVKAWAAGGARPPGLDDDDAPADVVAALRQILGLPLLTVDAEVLAQIDTLLAKLMPAQPTNTPAGSAGPVQETLMDKNQTGATSGAKDAQPVGALLVAGADIRVTLARICAKRLNCSVDDVNDGHILQLANGAADVQAKIDELMAELGAKTFAEALAKIGSAKALEAKLKEALEGKQAAEEAMSGYEESMMEEDVGMALASLGVTDEAKSGKIRKALLADRGTTPESIATFRKTYDLDALRKAAREELAKAAARVVADRSGSTSTQPQPVTAHLTAPIATERQTPAAVPQDGVTLSMSGGKVVLGASSREDAPGARSAVITLSALRERFPDAPNDYLRKVAFIKAEHAKNHQGGPALDHTVACERASALRVG